MRKKKGNCIREINLQSKCDQWVKIVAISESFVIKNVLLLPPPPSSLYSFITINPSYDCISLKNIYI